LLIYAIVENLGVNIILKNNAPTIEWEVPHIEYQNIAGQGSGLIRDHIMLRNRHHNCKGQYQVTIEPSLELLQHMIVDPKDKCLLMEHRDLHTHRHNLVNLRYIHIQVEAEHH